MGGVDHRKPLSDSDSILDKEVAFVKYCVKFLPIGERGAKSPEQPCGKDEEDGFGDMITWLWRQLPDAVMPIVLIKKAGNYLKKGGEK